MNLKLIKHIRTALFFFSIIWNANRFYLLSVVFVALLNWMQTIGSILLTEKLLTELQFSLYTESLLSALGMLSLIFIISITQRVIIQKQVLAKNDLHTKMRTMIANHYAALPYYITQQHNNQEAYEMAMKCIKDSYAEMYVSSILNIIFNFITLGSLVYILRVFPLWILMLFIIVLLIDIIVYLRQANLLYANYIDETPIERGLYYARGRLMRREFAKEIRVYGLENFISKKTEDAIKAFFSQSEKTRKLEICKLFWTYLAESIQFVGIYVLAIIEYYKDKTMPVGQFSLIITSSTSFSHTIRAVAADCIKIYKNLSYLEKLYDFLKLDSQSNGSIKLSHLQHHHFCFDHVYFKYEGTEEYSLYDINFDFQSNDKISVVGENGAGKTTFVLLLIGFLKPTQGRILIDGIDINEIDREEYLTLFSTIFQDYILYPASIKENVVLSQKYNEKAFFKSLKDAGVRHSQLDEYVNTSIGNILDPNGVELSGGESQKIALARAIYKNSKMFILDEPTSALDPSAECDFYNNFKQSSGNRGCIFISHRLASAKLCDMICVFDKGRLAEVGTHSALMKANGVYQTLFSAQSEKFSDYMKDKK